MKIISKRTEKIKFSIIIEGNTSEDLCEIPFDILTISTEGFKSDGYASSEYTEDRTTEVVCVNERYFVVSQSTSDFKKYWPSVCLPTGMNPRHTPREWTVQISCDCNTGNEYIWDTRCTGGSNPKTIKVREVID